MLMIGIDLDGSICNTIEVVYGRFFDQVDPSILGTYNLSKHGADADFFRLKWVYRKAKPYRGAAKVLRALAASGCELVYISARPELLRSVTEQWLKRHGFPTAEMVLEQSKAQVIRERQIQLMFEDAPHEVQSLMGVTELIVLDRPYNRNIDVCRAENWLSVPGLLRAMKGEKRRLAAR